MGYSEEGSVARAYRDSRINRIFEGTNEINRMVILSSILKSAMKGELDLMTPGMKVQDELMNGSSPEFSFEGAYAQEWTAVYNFKKVLIMLLGSAAQQAMSGKLDLKGEQEILMNLADIIIEIFNTESTLMRVQKWLKIILKNIDVYNAILETLIYDATGRITKQATDAIASFIAPEMQAGFVSGLRKFTKYPLVNIKESRRKIAETLIQSGGYCF